MEGEEEFWSNFVFCFSNSDTLSIYVSIFEGVVEVTTTIALLPLYFRDSGHGLCPRHRLFEFLG